MFVKGKIFIYSLLLFFLGFSFSNEFNIYPSSGSTLKYYCDQQVQISIKKGNYPFNTFASVIKFDTGNIYLSHNSINSFFNTLPTGYVLNDLYFTEGANMFDVGNVDMNVATFTIKTIDGFKPIYTLLEFVDIYGNYPTFGQHTTDDGITITSPYFVGDTLTGTKNVLYYFEAYPCVDDNNPPIVFNNSWSPNINGGKILGSGNNIRFLIIDWINLYGHYRYQGLVNDINNYVLAPNNVDNQNGVDSGTINVVINNTANGGNIELPSLNIYPYDNTEFPNKWTWNSNYRGYWVEFQNQIPFEVEKMVTIIITGYDNLNYYGNRNLINKIFNFNISENPIIDIVSPSNGDDYQNYFISDIYFQANDSWAGIDTGKVWITIPEIFSGTNLLLTGYTYSGSDLDFVLIDGHPGIGNSGSYMISLIPKRIFPSNYTITITGTVVDLAGNTGYNSWYFSTKPSCFDLGCFDVLNINFLSGIYSGLNPWLFSGQYLIVTGLSYNTNYPYITGTNSDILVCGFDYIGTILTGNVNIYSYDGVSIINGYLYTGSELFITGLDFVYNNGTINIIN